MYLPSKTKLKVLFICFLTVLLFFLPFKSALVNLFTFFSHKLQISPRKVSQENQRLKQENIALQIKVRESEHLKKENNDLKKILGFKESKGIDLTGVGVLSFSPSSWRRYLIIDGGEDIGLEKGLLAVDSEGKLIGKIDQVEKTSSRLFLVNDPNFTLSVFIGETGMGLLKGNLTEAKVLYIEDGTAIKRGDRVWVIDGSSESTIEVGKVKAIRKSTNQLFYDITVRLNLEEAFLDKVFILK